MSLSITPHLLFPVVQPTYTFHGGPSPRPRRCHACKQPSCSNTASRMCQTHPAYEKKSMRISFSSYKARTSDEWVDDDPLIQTRTSEEKSYSSRGIEGRGRLSKIARRWGGGSFAV